jgi:hypothetical protein
MMLISIPRPVRLSGYSRQSVMKTESVGDDVGAIVTYLVKVFQLWLPLRSSSVSS